AVADEQRLAAGAAHVDEAIHGRQQAAVDGERRAAASGDFDALEEPGESGQVRARARGEIRLHGAPSTPARSAGVRYSNHSFVASAIDAGFQTGASRQYSMFCSMIATPSSNVTFGFQPRTRWILRMSANVESGSPGRFGMWTVSPPRSCARRLTL